jgi:hypothetical protein
MNNIPEQDELNRLRRLRREIIEKSHYASIFEPENEQPEDDELIEHINWLRVEADDWKAICALLDEERVDMPDPDVGYLPSVRERVKYSLYQLGLYRHRERRAQYSQQATPMSENKRS